MVNLQQISRLLGIGFLALSFSVDAAVFNVNSTSSAGDALPGDGICSTSSNNGTCTLPAALAESNVLLGVDTINLPANTYPTGGFISDGLILVGAGAATTIIDGFFLDFFNVNTDQPVSISGLTVRGVTGTGSYGIFLGEGGDLTLSEVQIRNIDGPAINTSNLGINQLTIENSLLEFNKGAGLSTRFGGALYLQGTGNVVVRDSTIRANSAAFGGGIYLKGTTLTLIGSTVSGNDSTAASNLNGGFGGGAVIVSEAGSLTVINSTISGNRAASSGGGIVIDDGSVSLYNATVTDNRADSDADLVGSGGGIIATSASFSTTNVLELRNSIVAQNSAALNEAIDCSTTNMTATSFGYNLLGAGSDTDCLITPAAGDQFGTVFSIDPKLGLLADNGGATQTHLLLVGSPALDAGNPAACDDASAAALSDDQRGFSRPLDGGSTTARCDIGSIEMYVLPVADAGPDQVVQYGENVTLSGAGSTAFAGIDTFSWSENPTPSVTLNDASTDTASFIAPDTAGDLVFDLSITDTNADTDMDSVTITVNAPPVADAGSDAVAYPGEIRTLDGTASADGDGTIDVYSWSQTGGTAVILSDADTDSASFTVGVAVGEVLMFELAVTDNTGAQHTDSVEITIEQHPAVSVVSSVLKSVKKLQKKSSIKKDRKSKKFLKKARVHLQSALSFYLAGDITNGASQVNLAIADLGKVRKSKSKVRKLINQLRTI